MRAILLELRDDGPLGRAGSDDIHTKDSNCSGDGARACVDNLWNPLVLGIIVKPRDQRHTTQNQLGFIFSFRATNQRLAEFA